MPTFVWRVETERAVLGGIYMEVADHYRWRDLLYVLDAKSLPTWLDWIKANAQLWAAYDAETGRCGGYAMLADWHVHPLGFSCSAHFCRLPHVPVTAAIRAGREWLRVQDLTRDVHAMYITTKEAGAATLARLLGFQVWQTTGGQYHGRRFRGWQFKPAGSETGRGAGGNGKRLGPCRPGGGAPAAAEPVQSREHVSGADR